MVRAAGLMLSALAVWFVAGVAEAAPPTKQVPPRNGRPSFGEYVIRTRHGKPVVQQTYRGYKSGFIPPAWMYYGYPHSGDGTGTGLEVRPY